MANKTTTEEKSSDKNVKRSRTLEGVVVGKSGENTLSVKITRVTRHIKYGKKVVKSKKFLVHDPNNSGEIGTSVVIVECRPISKKKRWALKTDVVINKKNKK